MSENTMLQLILDEVKGLGSRMDSLENKVDSLENKIDIMQGDIRMLRYDVTNIKEDIDILRVTSMDMKHSLSSLGVRQVKLDMKLTALSDELGEISEIVINNYKRLNVTTEMAQAHERRLKA